MLGSRSALDFPALKTLAVIAFIYLDCIYDFGSSSVTAFVRLRLNLLSRSGTDNDMAGAPLHSDGLRIDLAEWLRTHGNRLLRSASLLCGDRTEAEDRVQETFLQAVKSAHLFRGELNTISGTSPSLIVYFCFIVCWILYFEAASG